MYSEFLKGLINPEFNEIDFDDAITKDKRTFLQFFTEKSFNNQIFIKTFYIKHIFKPLPLKIMYLVLTIELYFVITAFFYTILTKKRDFFLLYLKDYMKLFLL